VIFTDGLFDSAPTPLMVLDCDLCYIAANQNYCEALQVDGPKVIGRNLFEVFPSSAAQQAPVREALAAALAGQTARIDAVPYDIAGTTRWWTANHAPVRDAGGRIVGVIQHSQDVTAQITAERMLRIVSEESDHRVRNILAKVGAMARGTARDTASLADYLKTFEPRIAAMGRAHDMLVRGGWEQLGLGDLVAAELEPYAGRGDTRIRVDGDNVLLSSRNAQAMGLALHELATNAAKYGALGVPDGGLAIAWHRRAEDGGLDFRWTESGVTPAPAHRRGFGSMIIDRILPAETGGRVTRELTPTGLDCRVVIPQP
jgi:PAS domain S-box-containing protein